MTIKSWYNVDRYKTPINILIGQDQTRIAFVVVKAEALSAGGWLVIELNTQKIDYTMHNSIFD